MSNIIQTFPKGSGGGHIVLDTNGTAVDQEKKLQFTGLDVSDDSTNEKTEVKAVGLNADSLNDIIQSASVQGNAVAGNGLVYSTTEQIVGRWVDGKPIYQITFVEESTGYSDNTQRREFNFSSSVSNVDAIINGTGYWKSLAGGAIGKIHQFGTSGMYIDAGLNFSSGFMTDTNDPTTCRPSVFCRKTYQAQNGITKIKIFVTLQYTKTTDT